MCETVKKHCSIQGVLIDYLNALIALRGTCNMRAGRPSPSTNNCMRMPLAGMMACRRLAGSTCPMLLTAGGAR